MANLWFQICVIISFCSQLAQSDANVSQNFTDEPDIIAIEGTNLTISCRIKDPATALWFRNGINLQQVLPNLKKLHYEINSNSTDDFALRIINITKDDIGLYQCFSYVDGQLKTAIRSVKLVPFDPSVLRPPQLGDDFIRYVAMLNVSIACLSGYNTKDSSNEEDAIKNWMTVSSDAQLNEMMYELSEIPITCTICDPALRNLPRMKLYFKITSNKGLILKSIFGTKEIETLVCVANGQNSNLYFTCFNTLEVYDITKSPQLRVECSFAAKNVLGCTIRGEELSYTFYACVLPQGNCNLNSEISRQDFFVATTPNPRFTVWEKSDLSAEMDSELAVVKDKRMCCSADQKQIILQLTIGHENHNITLEIPIDVKSETAAPGFAIFQVTCFYWIWKDKVLTIFHEGIIIPSLCKILTLRIKVSVCDKSVLEIASPKCIFLNKPKAPYSLQQFSKIPNIYPIAGVICLSCVCLLTMIYIGRRLLALYDRACKPTARRQIQRLVQVVPVHSPKKKTYARFRNEDETIQKKVTLI